MSVVNSHRKVSLQSPSHHQVQRLSEKRRQQREIINKDLTYSVEQSNIVVNMQSMIP